MRMKFNKSSQLLLVSAASLLVAGLLTACETLTVDFVYVTSAKAAGTNNYGEVDVYEINAESGFMRQIPTSPFPSGGRNPVADAVSKDASNLYVVNQDDNTIVQFAIGNDGKLYPQNTVNTPGVFPLAVAVSGANLFVLDTYQPLPSCSSASPCSGSIAVYPIATSTTSTANGVLGSPLANGSLSYWPLSLSGANATDVLLPTGLTVLTSGSTSYLYVTAYDTTATTGYVFGFSIGSSGALTPLNGGAPFAAGTHPSAIAGTASGTNVYVADAANGDVLGYSVSSGILQPLTSGTKGGNTFPAGTQPSALVVDPSGSYAYVTNALDSSVTAYSISGGALTSLGSFPTGLQPMAVGIDANLHHFLFTANFLGNSVSGFELNPTNGMLINSQNSPYASNAQPTAVVAIPHNGTTN
jgi:6-phosphogluconolactonase (cycloisomerase 2 family)